MYEHLRNSFVSKLMPEYGKKDIDKITTILDGIVKDYDITNKCTDLAVLTDTVPQEVKIYLASKRIEGLSDKTIANYQKIITIFFERVNKQPQEVTTNDIRLYLAAYKMQRKVSDRTLEKYREILYCFFSWLSDEEYITKNPCRTIRPFKYEQKPRKALTRFQLELLRRMIHDNRELAIIDVLFSTGCRVSELVNMKLSDIDLETKSIHIIGKGNKHNTVYLNDKAYISIKEYMKTRKGNSDYLFVRERRPYDKLSARSVEVMLKKYEKPLGCTLSPHIIRHTTATLGLQAGMTITEVQKMLGHANVSTTQIYAETLQTDVMQAHKRYVV